jgi:alanyl-tRNA synthetase
MIRENLICKVSKDVPISKAHSMGAMALFGEKYGDTVRVVEFGNSVELCGGTHVESTGTIGIVKIISEGAIAAGVRRIEALTAAKAEEYINEKLNTISEIAGLLKSSGNITESVEKLLSENSSLKKMIEKYQMQSARIMVKELIEKSVTINEIIFISGKVEAESADILKNIAYQMQNAFEKSVMVIGSENAGKANILVRVSDDLVKNRNINAITIIKDIAGEINGGGGGQPFLATAGGKNPAGIERAIKKAEEYLKNL